MSPPPGDARVPAPLRAAHASGVGAVERELASLHRAMLRAGDGDRMVRLSVLTLVAACADDEAAEAAAEVVGAIAAEHPARAILLVADPDAPPGVEADLSLRCSAAQGRDQVCAETVRLRVGGEAARHLGSVVAPLILPDIPVQLWLVGAPPLEQALSPESLAVCERVVLDSAAYPESVEVLEALAALPEDREGGVRVSDLAWLRIAPWRELVARAFDAPQRRPFLGGVERVCVHVESPHDDWVLAAPPEALYLAGWLADRLPAAAVGIETRDGPGPGHLVGLSVEAISEGHRLGFELHRAEDGLDTRVEIDGEPVAARRVPQDAPDLAQLVGAALQAQGHDRLHLVALRAALGIVEAR